MFLSIGLLPLGTVVGGWVFMLCLWRMPLCLHICLFLARNATHFNNKYLESILLVILLCGLLKVWLQPLVLAGIDRSLTKGAIAVPDAHPAIAVVLAVILGLGVVAVNYLGHVGLWLRNGGSWWDHAAIGWFLSIFLLLSLKRVFSPILLLLSFILV